MDLTERYKITARPNYRTVTPGAVASYYCREQGPGKVEAHGAARDEFQWYCFLDRLAAKDKKVKRVSEGPDTANWEGATWGPILGAHEQVCCITFADPKGTKCYYRYPQWVDSVEAVLNAAFRKGRKQWKLPSPYKQYSLVRRYIKILEDGAKKFPIRDRDKREKHENRLKELTKYKNELGTLLDGTWNKPSFPVYATHLTTTEQRKTQLRLYIVDMGEGFGSQQWRLVDWTNPLNQKLRGIYHATGKTDAEAIQAAMTQWATGNGVRYWPGRMRYEVPARKETGWKPITGTFKTAGKNFWDSVSEFFSEVALGAQVLAAVVTLVAPVPGSRVISGLLWTSIFSSSVSAVVNIGQRHEERFGTWKDDAADTLTLVGNVFSGTWIRCASITVKSAKVTKLAKVVLIGDVTKNGVEGIVVVSDFIGRYDQIMKDPNLTPEERAQKLAALYRELALKGVLTYMSVKGSFKDLASLKTDPTGAKNLKKLKDPDSKVEVTDEVVLKGHTRNKRVRTEARDEQVRQQTRSQRRQAARRLVRNARRARKFPNAHSANSRGMRKRDNAVFSQMAKGGGKIIIVRNSNAAATQYVGKKGYKPKPEAMKAKTRKSPPNEGLAAADPGDPRFKELMQQDGCSNPREWVDKKLGKDWTIGTPEQGYVIRDPQGNAYYSDYDLHGVYDGKTGANAYSEGFRDGLNRRMGEDMVQHGTHDQWGSRNNPKAAGDNYGPQPPCTAYTPDGKAVHLETVADMKAFYKEHNINFDAIYPNTDYPNK